MADDFRSRALQSALAERAYGSVYSSQYADAQKSANANEAARRLGLHPDLVEADMPNMLAEDRLRKRIAETRTNEAYARIMSNRRLAASAIDDDELPKVAERTQAHVEASSPSFSERRAKFGFVGALTRSLRDTVASAGTMAGIGLGGAVEGVGDFVSQAGFNDYFSESGRRNILAARDGKAPGNFISNAGRDIAEFYREQNKATSVQYGNKYVNMAARGFESVPMSAMALIMAVRGDPKAALAMQSSVSGGAGYSDARKDGQSPLTAARYAGTQAGLEAAGEMLPMGRYLHDMENGAGLFKRITGQLITENIGEQVTGHLQDLDQWATLEANHGKTFTDYLKERPDAALQIALATTAATGLQTGAAYSVEKTLKRYDDKRRDANSVKAVSQIMEAAASSQTRAHNPSDFREALNQLVGGTEASDLYVPVQAIVDHVGEEPVADHPVWGPYAQQIADAQALGGDVVLPLADVATDLAGTPAWEAIKDHVRTRPGGSSLSEAKNKATPEELERQATEGTKLLGAAVGQLQTLKARQVVGRFAENIVSEGPQATAVNRMLTNWLVTRHNAENAKRAARGEGPVSIEQFGEANLPTAVRMLQAQFEAGQDGALGTKTPAPVITPTTPARVTRPAAKPRKAQSLIAFIRANGGINNNEGHDLSKGRGLSRHPGLINNKSGRSIDEIGELAWEAGFFGDTQSDRPTTAQVLELLDNADMGRVVRPADALEDALAHRNEQGDAEEAEARAEIERLIAEAGMTFSPDEVDSMMVYRGSGMSGDEAIQRVMDDINVQLADELDGESETGYDYKDAADDAFDATFYQNGGSTASRGEGQDGQQGATGTGEEGTSQSDILAGPGDLRYWLQAQTEGRLKGSKPQKAPGSDGGLFDTPDTQTTLLQSETPFDRWFGESKVVDKNGSPLVVYHGTAGQIEAFDPESRGSFTGAESAKGAFWFTDRKKTADYYADHATRDANLYRSRKDPLQSNVVDAYLSLQNPLIVDMKNRIYREQSYAELLQQAKAGGHDGLIIKRTFDAGEYGRFDALLRGRIGSENIYAAFHPTQIKSTANRGTFDPQDPRILNQTVTPEDRASFLDAVRAPDLVGTFSQPVYHGSPHTFDRFSLDHIGSGEGAQAYGWGLYFAGKKGIAEYYRQALGEGRVQFPDGTVVSNRTIGDEDTIAEAVIAALDKMGLNDPLPQGASQHLFSSTIGDLVAQAVHGTANIEDAIKETQEARETQPDRLESTNVPRAEAKAVGEAWGKAEEALKALVDAGMKNVEGRLYHVEIPDDGEYLLWDKPLSEQPEKVKAALAKMGLEAPPLPSPPSDTVIASIIKGALKHARNDATDIALTIDNDSMLYNKAVLHAERAGVDMDDFDAGEYVVRQAADYVRALENRELLTGEALYKSLVKEAPDKARAEMQAVQAERDALGLGRGEWPDDLLERYNAAEAATVGSAARHVSHSLHDAGIAGIKYLDGISRDAGEGDHNYVLFDDKQAQIRHYEQQKRGNISILADPFGMMESALIRAFESANFSTAVHELGHFFLEDLRRRALASDATDQELKDWATFKGWATELGHAVTDDSPIPVDAHEYFARGFERYTFEGKAPTPALRGLFFQLREFMKKLYTRASQFNAPITPEIREVMGRLIASDAEVQEQTREMNLAAGKIDELMTPDERRILADLTTEAREDARDQVLERALSALRQEKTAEVRERKSQIKQEVAAEVDQQPIFRALKLLKVGIPQVDGGFIKVRLGREQLTDAYGPDVLDTLPKLVPEIHSDKDAQDIDTVAELSGFDSGDALVKALQGHAAAQAEMKESGDKRSPRARMIDEQVEDRVREEIGDPFENLEEEAQAAVANERQADALSLELRAIARKTGKKPTPWKLAKEFAAKYVLKATSAEAISGKAVQMYNRNAMKAGQEAVEAIIKGDMDAAFAAKQRQLLNLALLSEAKIAKDKVDAAEKRLKKIAKRTTIPSVDQDYLEQAQALLEDVAMGDESRPAIERRKSFEDWYLQQVAEGKDPVVPKEYARLLGKGNWRDLSIESFLELDGAVSQIIQLGRLKQTLRDGRDQRDFNEAVVDMVERINAEVKGRKVGNENDPSRSFMGALKSKIRSADSWMVTARSLVSWFDGNDTTGPWHRLLLNPFSEAQGRADDLMREYGERMNEMIAALPKAQLKALKRKVDTPELINHVRDHPGAGQPFIFHMDQILVMAMNWGNEGNRQRLLDGFGWQEEQVEAVLDRLMTKELWDFVSQTWEVVNRLWPDLAEMERRVNGVAPEKIEGIPVETRFGTYQGGYFPIVYDSQYSSRTELNEAAKLSPGGGMQQVAVRSGASHNRVEQVKGRPLLLSISLVTNHMTQVVHDITHREAVHQAKRIITDDRIRTAIITKFGKEYHEALGTWLKNIASPGVAFAEASRASVAFGRYMTAGMSVVGLGLRVTTILVQPVGLLNVASRVGGPRLLMDGVWSALRAPVATYNEITSKSAMMRARFSHIDTSMADIIAKNGSKLEKMGMGNIFTASGAFRPIAFMDSLVATAGWIAAYNQGLQGKAHGSPVMTEEEAIAYADDVILSTQGGGGMMDRAAMMNDHPLVRVLYPFFSFANAMFNQQRDAVRLMGKEGMDNKIEGVRRAWWVFVVPVLVQALLFGDGPDAGDDDETTAEDWLRYLAGALMVGNTYSLPIVGPIVNAWGNGYGYRSSALQAVGEDSVKVGKDIYELATKEDEELGGQTVKKLFNIAGIAFHKPLGQPGGTIGGLIEYARGNEHPEDIGDWYELLAKGRTSKGPTAVERMAGETDS